MIEDYRGLAVFVAVADCGSFSATGRKLKLSTSVVSHHISRLEKKLGVSLFFRSTRSLSLTPEGEKILEAARRMVSAGEEALDALAEDNDQPVGSLRISLPAFGDQSDVYTAVWKFASEHPMVSVTLNNSDAPADLVKDGFDLAIRLGVMKDSSLKSRKIGEFHRVLVASRDFFINNSPIESLDDLARKPFIAVSMLPTAITFMKDQEQTVFEPTIIRIEVDSINAAKSAVLAGLGIQHLPRNEIETELVTGELVPVLSDYSLPIYGIYAVWPNSATPKKLTRRLIDFLVDYPKSVSVPSEKT